MFTSISKGVNQTHRSTLKQAIQKENKRLASHKNFLYKHEEKIIVLVGTKNIISNIFMTIFSKNTIVLYFTGFGRLYTDFAIFGRLAFMIVVVLSSLRKNRYFIVENSYDHDEIARFSWRPVTQVNGSGFNKLPYKKNDQFTVKSSKGDIKVLGHMSRFGSSKCTTEIIKLIKKLPPNYRIIIAGKDIRGSYYSNIFYKIAEENPQVEMLGYLDTSKEISEFFDKIDLFLYPSAREGLPMTLIESIYHQVPFLTTNVAGCIDISNRFGFPTCSPEDFGELDKLIKVEQWGSWKPSWNKILNEYSFSYVQSQFEFFFSKIIEDLEKNK